MNEEMYAKSSKCSGNVFIVQFNDSTVMSMSTSQLFVEPDSSDIREYVQCRHDIRSSVFKTFPI